MLDIQYIREHKEAVLENCKHRRASVDLDALLTLDTERREVIQKMNDLRTLRNKTSKGKPTEEEIVAMRKVGEEIKGFEAALADIEARLHPMLLAIPNHTHPQTPVGGEADFVVLSTGGTVPTFDFEPKDHEALMVQNNMIDFERAAKVSGAKFYFVKNDGVRLNMALLNYGLDVLSTHGFEIMETPDLAKNEVIEGLGFSPRGNETQIYNIENTDMSLIGTAEITLGGYHKDEIIDLSNGPKKYAAISHCFRTEAGSYGRTSKGLYRVHQFTKLEMFVCCKPEESEKLHDELLAIEKEIVDGLEIPYQVIDIASGDLGGPAYRKYDIEAWMIMSGGYGEITSTSNCTDYQARRLNIRYKNDQGETAFVHTLNGTAVVLSRFPIAVIENYQNADGSIRIPKVLQPYMGKDIIT